MRTARIIPVLALVSLVAFAVPVVAAEPELVSPSSFSVSVAGGTVDVSFTLAMSEVNNYPVTITAVSGSTEEVLYQGSLSGGVYRLRAPLTKISGGGDLKVILKTRITNRSDKGNESFSIYLKWQGAM